MYIDSKEPPEKMEQEVNDATAALKGMLGIGSALGAPVAATPTKEDAAVAVAVAVAPAVVASPPNSEGVPKSKKKNKKKGKPKGEQQQQQQQQGKQPPEQKGKPKEGNPNQQKSVKKKGSKKNKNNGKGSENFAWSAFQSSPDASKLPMPAFSSPSNTKTIVSVDAGAPIPGDIASSAVTPLPPIRGGGVIANNASDDDAPKDAVQVAKRAESPEAPVSKTGVNLAALSSNTPPTNPTTPYMQRQMPPQNHPAQYNSPQMPPQYPQQYQSPPPPQQQQQPHHQQQQQQQQQQQHYPPPPPPGYVTVQVQVPPVLMPGRQMVVTSPAGYPVQVVVPAGIPPGFILPVHVPAGPPHMMPPPGQSPYGRQY